MNRFCFAAFVAGSLSFGSVAWAQEKSPVDSPRSNNQNWRYDAVGRLMRNKAATGQRRGANVPPYVLVDKTGQPRCYITPEKGVDINAYVNERIGVRGSVQTLKGDRMPMIVARGVRPIQEQEQAAGAEPAAEAADPKVVAAAHLQPTPAREELPTPQPDPAISGQGEVIGSNPGAMMSDPNGGPAYFDQGEGAMFGGPQDGCADGCCENGCCQHDNCNLCCNTCPTCCNANDPGMWWVRGEYLLWSTKGMYIPPLVTTGPGADNPGVLGEPGTVILFGDQTVNNDIRSGGRISFGRWLDPCQTWGLGGEYFALENQSTNFTASSTGVPALSRPFFNINPLDDDDQPIGPPVQDVELVALEDVLSGTVAVKTSTAFQGAGAWVRYNMCCKNMCWNDCCHMCDPCYNGGGIPGGIRVGLLGGYRFLNLRDSVSIREDLVIEDPDGTSLVKDRFNTRNQFNGAEIGFVLDARKARWTLELIARMALGGNHETVRINGSTVNTQDGVPTTYTGGLLAQTSNIGTYNRDQFAVIPQLGATLGYNLTRRLRATVGYTFIYWSQVVRAGNQIDLDVNPALIPPPLDPLTGPLRPAFAWNSTDFWAQGINLGLDYRF